MGRKANWTGSRKRRKPKKSATPSTAKKGIVNKNKNKETSARPNNPPPADSDLKSSPPPEAITKLINTSNADETPVDCVRGRRNRASRMTYFDDLLSTSEDEDEDIGNDDEHNPAKRTRLQTQEMPVLVPKVRVTEAIENPPSDSELLGDPEGQKKPSNTSNAQRTNRKRKRKKKLTLRKNHISPSATSVPAPLVAPPPAPAASSTVDNLQVAVEGDVSDCEIEIKELRICLTRVDELEEFRASLQKFKENLAHNLTSSILFGSDSESESDAAELSEHEAHASGDEYRRPKPNSASDASPKSKAFRCNCKPCKGSFDDEEALKDHMRKVHPQRTKCNYCSRFFPDPKQLEAHETFHSNKTKLSSIVTERFDYVCQFCQKRFKKQNGLTRHISQVHSIQRGSVSLNHMEPKTIQILRKQIAVAKKHIRPIRKESFDEITERILPELEPVRRDTGPIYVRNDLGIIDLGPVKEEMIEQNFEQPEPEMIPDDLPPPPLILKVNGQMFVPKEEEEACPMADMFEITEEVSTLPPPATIDGSLDSITGSSVPFDMTNGVQCNISDMGSLLDLLDGPDPHAGIPGQPKGMLTLNYEDGNKEEEENDEDEPDVAGRFKCDFCPRVLGSKLHLLSHRRDSHSARIRKPYICLQPNCSQRFVSSQALQFHRNKEHTRKEDVVAEAPVVTVTLPNPVVEPTTPKSFPVFEETAPVQAIPPTIEIMAVETIPPVEVSGNVSIPALVSQPEVQLASEPEVTHDSIMPVRLTDDLLKGFKYGCPVCGAKFKKMSLYLQHEWSHADQPTKKKKEMQQQRRQKLVMSKAKGTGKRRKKATKESHEIEIESESILPFTEEDLAGEEDEINRSLESEGISESESNTLVIPTIRQVPKTKPILSVAPVQHSRFVEPPVGSPQSNSNSSEDSIPVLTDVLNGVSFRICRDAEQVSKRVNSTSVSKPPPARANAESKICDICAHVCYGTFGLENHMLTEHNLILCIACNLCSTSQATHEFHLLTAHPTHKFFCKPCIKLLHNDIQFARHIESEPHRQKELLRKAEVMAESEQEVNLDCEVECHHRHYICDICSSGQHTLPKLELHILQIHQQFLCSICQKLYGSRRGLVLHRQGHVGESKFDCLLCMMPFTKKASLASHQKSRGHMHRVKEVTMSSAAPTLPAGPGSVPDPGEDMVCVRVSPNKDSAEVVVESVDSVDETEEIDKEQISIHEMLRNPKTGDYQCCLCFDEFLDFDVFDDHMVVGHSMGQFKRIAAGVRKIFESLKMKPQLFKCTACKKIFMENSAFKRHWPRYHSENNQSNTTPNDVREGGDSDIEILEERAGGKGVSDPAEELESTPSEPFLRIETVTGTLSVNDIVSGIVKESIPGSTQLAQMLQTPGKRRGKAGSTPPAPIRTTYSCGKCDIVYTNQVDLNNHVVSCIKDVQRTTIPQPRRPVATAAKNSVPIGDVRADVEAKQKPVAVPQIIDLTLDDDDDALSPMAPSPAVNVVASKSTLTPASPLPQLQQSIPNDTESVPAASNQCPITVVQHFGVRNSVQREVATSPGTSQDGPRISSVFSMQKKLIAVPVPSSLLSTGRHNNAAEADSNATVIQVGPTRFDIEKDKSNDLD